MQSITDTSPESAPAPSPERQAYDRAMDHYRELADKRDFSEEHDREVEQARQDAVAAFGRLVDHEKSAVNHG
jgi:hypothetical protein